MNENSSDREASTSGIEKALVKTAVGAAAVGAFLYLFNLGDYSDYNAWPTVYSFPAGAVFNPATFSLYLVATMLAGLLFVAVIGALKAESTPGLRIWSCFGRTADPLFLLWIFPVLFGIGLRPNFIWLFSFLVFTAWAMFQFVFHFPWPEKAETNIEEEEQNDLPPVLDIKVLAVLAVCGLGFVILFSTLTILQYHVGEFGYADSGFVAEALWNTLHGRFMYAHGFAPPMLLADHFSPIWLALIPFYAIYPAHETLMVISALVIAATTVPLFFLARWEWKDNGAALCLAVAFLLYPAAQHEVSSFSFGFQAEVVALPFLAWACYCMRRHQWGRLCFALLLVLCCKETLSAVVFGVGICVFLIEGQKKIGTAIMAGAVVWLLGMTKVILPWLKGGEGEYYQLTQFYGHLGDTYTEIVINLIKNIFTDPVTTLRLNDRELWMFLSHMLIPLGLLSILSPAALLLGMPNFVMMLFNNKLHIFSIYHHYRDPLIVVPFFAAVLGVRYLVRGEGKLIEYGRRLKLDRWLECCRLHNSKTIIRAAAAMILLGSFMNCYYFGPTPLSKKFQTKLITMNRRSLALARMKQRIEMDTTIVTTHRAGAHFTDRKQLYSLPLSHRVKDRFDIYSADYLLIDLKDRWGGSGQAELVREILKEMPNRKEFRLVSRDESFRLYRKTPASP